MEDYFVKYDHALALKELGFNELCIKYQLEGHSSSVKNHRVPGYLEMIKNSELDAESVAIPLKYQLFEWFRKTHSIDSHIERYTSSEDSIEYFYCINSTNFTSYYFESPNFESHEEAENGCIDKLIEIIKNK